MSIPPIAFAVLGGDLKIVKDRVDAGADIDEVTDKGTALHVACQYEREEICRFLLENGANPRAKDKFGRMPIDVAEDARIVALLREYGVEEFGIHDFNTLNRAGQRNAFVLANKNDVKTLEGLVNPLDMFHGVYVHCFSNQHLRALEERLGVTATTPLVTATTQSHDCATLYRISVSALRCLELVDEHLLSLATDLYKARPFAKTSYWDKFRVFQLLCSLRTLSFIAKKRRLGMIYQEWNSIKN